MVPVNETGSGDIQGHKTQNYRRLALKLCKIVSLMGNHNKSQSYTRIFRAQWYSALTIAR